MAQRGQSAWLTVDEAAAELEIGESTFLHWLEKGAYPFADITDKVGGRRKVSRHRLDLFQKGELPPQVIDLRDRP